MKNKTLSPKMSESFGCTEDTSGGSYIDDESTQLVLLQRDDFMIAGLLRQLQQGARRRQP